MIEENQETSNDLSRDDENRNSLPPLPDSYEDHLDDIEKSKFFQEPPVISGTIDVSAFVKAQAEFIKMQTWFLHSGNPRAEPEEYIRRLTQFSHAQTAFIEAQSDVLRKLGVI